MSKLRVLAVVVVVAVAAMSAQASDTAATFKAKCAMCHGADGVGKTPMGTKLSIRDLTGPEAQKMTDAEMVKVITAGKNKMPAYAGKLTKGEIGELAEYIHKLGKK